MSRARRAPWPALSVLLAVSACGPRPEILWPAGPQVAEGDAPATVLVVPNIDDDDGDGQMDWDQAGVPGDNDRAVLQVANKARPTTLTLSDPDSVRVYVDGEAVLGPDADTWTLPDRKRKATLTLGIEARSTGNLGSLTLTDDRSGEAVTVDLRGTPPTLGHHGLPTQHVWVVAVNDGPTWNNDSMVARLQALLGDRLTVVDGPSVDWDVWIQDEPEFLTLYSPDARAELVLDSIRSNPRDGGLDRFTKALPAPDRGVRTVGEPLEPTTFDAFGNLEATPPLTVDGVDYPLGRIYYGWNGDDGRNDMGPHPDVRDWLATLEDQDPFWVDTSWLCVGHVDEFVTFVPDPDAPRGFRMLYADTDLGFEVLAQRPASTRLQRHGRSGWRGHGRPTIGSYTNDAALRAYNEDLQAVHLEPLLDRFRQELALTDDEIVRVPQVFEEWIDEWGVCGAAAVIPAPLNLLMITDEDGLGGTAIMADPFVRSDREVPGQDVFIQAWRERLPATINAEFVDDWDVYHMGGGEVHCGTNQTRTPALATVDLATWLDGGAE